MNTLNKIAEKIGLRNPLVQGMSGLLVGAVFHWLAFWGLP